MNANIFSIDSFVLIEILKNLDAKSILNFCSTCKQFNQYKGEDSLWRHLNQKYGYREKCWLSPYESYKDTYKKFNCKKYLINCAGWKETTIEQKSCRVVRYPQERHNTENTEKCASCNKTIQIDKIYYRGKKIVKPYCNKKCWKKRLN